MADVTTDIERMLSSYGGRKSKIIVINSMSTGDIIKLDAEHSDVIDVSGLQEINDTTGRLPLSFTVTGTPKNELTLKTASKTGIKVAGQIIYKAI